MDELEIETSVPTPLQMKKFPRKNYPADLPRKSLLGIICRAPDDLKPETLPIGTRVTGKLGPTLGGGP
jgi:hypothetical protein